MTTNSTVRRWAVPALIGIVVGGTALTLVAVWTDQPVGELLLLGVGVGGLIGTLAGMLGRAADPNRPPIGAGDPYLDTLDSRQRRAFRRQALRGPEPADPDRRAAAIRLVRRTLDNESSDRRIQLVLLGWWIVVGLVNTFDRDPWSLLLVVLAAAVFVWTWRRPDQLRRRLAALRAYPDPVDTDTAQPG